MGTPVIQNSVVCASLHVDLVTENCLSVGCRGRKIHPVYSIQNIPEQTEVRSHHLPHRKNSV